ncbi:uncharacterized protein LOC108145786 [Drosophila elegans]|uniref:uncharacterized protein LOC108145786 n=1 Tax=Drosophila elegans TaxID=30023 RepID=UPI0007E82E1E|nr:uncharacterized protein LOC108145786 [Drosophila elegans]XP_017126845.1 uncharacterized protein LOC108145786 [Drosophila elegans]
MGATTAKPFSETESKAFAKFLRSFKKDRGDMDEDEIQRSAENAWGKLLPYQKQLFEVKPRGVNIKKQAEVKRRRRLLEGLIYMGMA